MNQQTQKTVLLSLVAATIVYVGIGLVFTFMNYQSQKGLQFCDPQTGVCAPRATTYDVQNLATDATLTLAWLPLILARMIYR